MKTDWQLTVLCISVQLPQLSHQLCLLMIILR